MAAAAAALALGWAALALYAFPDPSRYSPGQVARVHAAWNGECAACHRPHSPVEIQADATLGVQGRWRDFTCNRCHGGAEHVPGTPLAQLECAGCHHDHRSGGHSLTSLEDTACTRCHENLAATHPTRELSAASRIRDVMSHPEFRKLDPDHPQHVKHHRKLKFSHSLHMAPGLSYSKEAKEQLVLGKVKPLYREQYRLRNPDGKKQGDGELVRLECASCHRLDSQRAGTGSLSKEDRARLGDLPAEALLPARAAGHYMLPVNYDLHCKGCHPLRNEVGDGRGSSYSLDPPHRVQPAAMREWLTAELTKQITLGRAQRRREGEKLGGRLDPRERKEIEESAAGRWLDLAMRNLFRPTGVCSRCHEISPDPAAIDEPRSRAIEPTNIPTVWLEKARFSHAAHRPVDCAGCHPGKEARWEDDGRTKVVEREPVGIPGVGSCRQCHGPPMSGGAGVRHGCTDCHRYHNVANPLQGVGATARDPQPEEMQPGRAKKWTIGEWLRGGR